MKQFTLGLALSDEATFNNFYAGDNDYLLVQLRAFAEQKNESFIYLWGSPGSGRTHLLQACCHAVPQAIYLDLAETDLSPEVLINLEKFPLICLDNLDAVMNVPVWELALFNFYNTAREYGGHLLVAALTSPAGLNCRMADLRSRLSSGLVLNLRSLLDDEKLFALQMRAHNRGLKLTTEVGNFLLTHFSRDMNSLFSILEKLDQDAMSAKHRLTIPFVKQALFRL